MRKPWFVGLVLVLALGSGGCRQTPAVQPEADTSPAAGTANVPTPSGEVKNPDTYVEVGLSDFIESLDPAYAYDTGSGTIILNVYDQLVMLEGKDPNGFAPMVASQVPSESNGLIRDEGKTYVFPIRQGITFHAGPVSGTSGQPIPGSGELTPEDVAYSFQRVILMDRAGGPSWLLLEPLVGASSVLALAKQIEAEKSGQPVEEVKLDAVKDASPETLTAVCQRVKDAVTVDGENVTFHLKDPFPAFLQILLGHWGSILDKEWVAAEVKGADEASTKKPGWDGDCATWQNFYDPALEDSPLRGLTNGSGPYKLVRWKPEEEVALTRNDAYWRDHPAPMKDVVIRAIPEFSTRLLMLQTGDADLISVPPENEDQIQPLIDQGKVTLDKNPDERTMSFWSMNQKVAAEDNEYIGSGKLDGEGIPPDFFGDPHVRKGFALAYDRNTFINDIVHGDGRPATTFVPPSSFGFNPDQETYPYDLDAAAAEFKQAWGGQVWDKGFKIIFPVVPGASTSRLHREMYAQSLAKINPKFKAEVRDVQASQMSEDNNADKVPITPQGWVEDYHDPHNWAFPLLHSRGYYALKYDFPAELQARMDDLINRGRVETDPEKRKQLYYELEKIFYDEALMIPIYLGYNKLFQRSWVKGFTYNPANCCILYWYLSKGE